MKNNVNSGRLTKFKGKIASIAPYVAGAIVLITSTGSYAADECGAEVPGAGAGDTVTCTTGDYPTGITYNSSDGLTVILDGSAITIGGRVVLTGNTALSIIGTNVGTINSAGAALDVSMFSGASAPIVRLTAGNITITAGNNGLSAQNFGTSGTLAEMDGGTVTMDVGANGSALFSSAFAGNGTSTARLTGGTIQLLGRQNGLHAAAVGAGDALVQMTGGTLTLIRGGLQLGEQAALKSEIANTNSTGTATAEMTNTNATITTAGDNAFGLYALTSGRGATLAQVSAGALSTSGLNSNGLLSEITNAASTATATALLSGTGAITTTGLNAYGLYATTSGNGAAIAQMDDGTVNTGGLTQAANASGLKAEVTNVASSATVTATLNLGGITTTGNDSRGLYATTNGTGTATAQMDGGTIDTTGTSAYGLQAKITSTTSTAIATANLTGGAITTTGNDSRGLYARTIGTGAATAQMGGGTVNTTGTSAYGLQAEITNTTSTATATALLSGTAAITTTGDDASGIVVAQAGLGSVVVTTTGGTITTSGANAHGIATDNAGATGTTTITLAGNITAGGDGINVNSLSSGAVLITGTGDITGGTDTGDDGIQVTAQGSVTINVNGTITGDPGIIVTTADGPIDISGTGDVTGNGGNGIEATITSTGNITINRDGIISGTGNGILATNTGTGNVNVTVNKGVSGGTGFGINTNTTAAGNSTIILNSGAIVTSGISNNEGNSTTTINDGASVAGNIVLGGGADSINITSTADISGVTQFDGGAGSDTLTLINRTSSIDGTNFTGWENITVDGGTLAIANGALTVGSGTGEGLTLTNSAVLNAGNGQTTITGNVINNGTLSMQDGAAGDTFTITGDYSGSGEVLLDIDTVASSSDVLAITGNVTGGTTRIIANNLTPSTAIDANGITVVTVGGTSVADAFVVTAGAFNYALAQDGNGDFVLTSGAFLASTLNSTGAVYSAVPYLLNSAFNRLSTLEQRVSASSRVDTHNKSTWMRVLAGSTESALMTSNTDSDTYGLQVGVDFDYDIDQNSHWVLGVTGQTGDLSATVSNPDGNASIDTKGYGLGLTATWYGNEGTYVDSQLQVNFLDTDMASSSGGKLVSDHSSTAYALSVEAGHRFGVSQNSAIIPQAQLNFGRVDGDDLTDNGGNIVKLGTNTFSLARLGIAYEYSTDDNNRAFIVANVFNDFSDDTQVDVSDIRLEDEAVNAT